MTCTVELENTDKKTITVFFIKPAFNRGVYKWKECYFLPRLPTTE
jgi:hypothetical protein